VADRNAIRRVIREFAMKKADVEALRDRLRDAKITVYEQTLIDLSRKLGITTAIDVSPDVKLALAIEAGNHARSIGETFNNDLVEYAFRFGRALDEDELRWSLQAWVENRNAQRAPLIAVTETYGPYADALMAGFIAAGLEDAEFDFGGHPELGDSPPECAICAELEKNGPWPVKTVIRIGTPHPACRQNWHPRDLEKLVEQLRDKNVQLGAQLAGIVGRRTLIDRAGGRRQAAQAIRSGRLPR
jgi:hypothetical protein